MVPDEEEIKPTVAAVVVVVRRTKKNERCLERIIITHKNGISVSNSNILYTLRNRLKHIVEEDAKK